MVKTKTGRDLEDWVWNQAAKMSTIEINREVDRLLDLGELAKAKVFANIWLRRQTQSEKNQSR